MLVACGCGVVFLGRFVAFDSKAKDKERQGKGKQEKLVKMSNYQLC